MRRGIGILVAVVLGAGTAVVGVTDPDTTVDRTSALPSTLAASASETTPTVVDDSPHVGLGTSPYAMSFYSVDAGGDESLAAGYRVLGTFGQPDASTSSGGEFILVGGFRGRLSEFRLFFDGFETGDTSHWTWTVSAP